MRKRAKKWMKKSLLLCNQKRVRDSVLGRQWYMDQQALAPLLVYAWDHLNEFGYVDALTGEYIKQPIDQEDE
ncbi:hypothetical protein [Aneurinibacillus migulanus]|uniref:Uncharacterized protein n=1 Tax=Aneurinibacillus migulanus TaxID=47500 RepID=A0A0M0H3R0_ANEMI|nr:hypothetical protein [Aneurinibacillus migulanus]KON96713.1 hypothetical protein AF333_15755 [Aneurinibacillus migulanus]